MTHIAKAPHDELERAKWRAQANNASKHLKGMKDFAGQENHLAAFVFDDKLVKLPINVSLIHKLSEQALADWIFETVLEAQAPVGDASPQPGSADEGITVAAVDAGANVGPIPTGSAKPEPCVRKLEPDFTERCPNHATGALRITLKPSPTVSKRWGMTSMLTFVMDLPLCPGCFQKVNVMEITDQDLRARLGKTAQQMNNGVLVDWKQTLIEHIPFDDPQLVGLRDQMAKRAAPAANDEPPAGEAA